ncbi:MAG: ECF-type sigma factor [Gemmatimonadota bacterium]|nr:ECF-type sigma factor [Gemmatimonadota bacterium]
MTRLLRRARAGDEAALERVYPLVYEELRAIAARRLAGEAPGHTLSATALVNEAYVKLAGSGKVEWQDRAHFLAVAARAMRQVLVDRARRRAAGKRGGGARATTLSGKDLRAGGRDLEPEDLLALDEALERLEAVDPRLRLVVELRYFGGLAEGEIARVLDVHPKTVQRDWMKARAWLHAALRDRPGRE